jgi:hypothetical protein
MEEYMIPRFKTLLKKLGPEIEALHDKAFKMVSVYPEA